MTQSPALNRRLALAVLALPTLLLAMDVTLLHLAVPALAADLEPSSTELLWIVDAYGLTIAAFLIPMGMLGDRIGRRRLLLLGGSAFAGFSVLAAFAPSAETLIAARALLGIAGATLMPSTLALIHAIFTTPAERTAAVGVWVASLSVGTVIGPVAGGAMLSAFWWGSVFLLALPVMGALLVLGPRLLPEIRDPEPGRIDSLSVALSLAGTIGAAYGIKRAAAEGIGPVAVATLGAGLVMLVVFVRRQKTLSAPLIDVRLFRVPAFSGALAANTLGMLAVVGVYLLIAQHLQLVAGLDELEAGLILLPYAAGIIVASTLAPALAARLGGPAVVGGGLAVMAAGLALLARIEPGSGIGLVVAGTVVLALGAAPVLTVATDLVVSAAPPERAGSAAAISETGTELGGALGVALLGSLATAVYRSSAGPGAPETLAAAAGSSPAVLAAARDAFADGLAAAALAGAAMLLVTAVAAALLMLQPGPAAALEGS